MIRSSRETILTGKHGCLVADVYADEVRFWVGPDWGWFTGKRNPNRASLWDKIRGRRGDKSIAEAGAAAIEAFYRRERELDQADDRFIEMKRKVEALAEVQKIAASL